MDKFENSELAVEESAKLPDGNRHSGVEAEWEETFNYFGSTEESGRVDY